MAVALLAIGIVSLAAAYHPLFTAFCFVFAGLNGVLAIGSIVLREREKAREEVPRTAYRQPRDWPLQFAIGVLTVAIVMAVLTGAATKEGALLVAAFFAVCSLPMLVPALWLLSSVAHEVEITTAEIRSRTSTGRRATIKWGEIDEAERFAFPLDVTRPDVYRLVAHGRGAVAFTSRIEGFGDLLTEIRKHTNVIENVKKPPWWRRLIYRGWP